MCRRPPHPLLTATLLATLGAMVADFPFGGATAEIERMDVWSEVHDPLWGQDVAPFPSRVLPNEPFPLPEAIHQEGSPEITLDLGGWKPILALGSKAGAVDERLSRRRRRPGPSPPAVSYRSLQVLFCTWQF